MPSARDIEDLDGDLVLSITGNTNSGLFTSTSIAAGVLSLNYAANANGSSDITVRATDTGGLFVESTFGVTVNPVNDTPVADSQSVMVKRETSRSITLTGSDIDGDALSFSIVVSPTSGTLTGTGATRTYSPDTGFTGSDSFSFIANDGTDDSATVTVTINVAANNIPVADAQSVNVNEDGSVSITLTGSDPDLDAITYSLTSDVSNGNLSGTAPNLTYTPDPNYNGSDEFTFIVNDGTDDSPAATVSINVAPVNDIPVAVPQSVTTDEDSPTAITLAGSDIDGDTLTYSIVDSPANGSLSGSGESLIYTPAADTNGSDSFTFKVNDGTVNSGIVTVPINVTPVNDAPVADSQSVSIDQDTSVAITLSGSDIDGDSLTFSVASGPTRGSLAGSGANLIYSPDPGYFGTDSFTYVANDGSVDSTGVTVSIMVNEVVVLTGPQLAYGVVNGVGNSWVTVNLSYTYTSMVVVASANYDDTTGPTVVRIRNAESGSSFEMLVQAAGGSAPTNIDVHYTVMEEGIYDEAGFKLEAVKFNSTVTDENNSWAGQSRTYGQSNTAPVVVGQVMTYNDSDWSNFWARGSSRTVAPSASTLFVGKMVGEDADNTRANETIGYFVIETSNDGVIEGLPFRAGVGGDTVKGVDDAPAYKYSYDPFTAGVPKAAVVSMVGMDGGNGGWAMLYGSNPLPETGGGRDLYLAVDEDQSKDTERKHTTEQVAYFIIDPPKAETKPSTAQNVPDPVDLTQHFEATMFDRFHGGSDVLFGGAGKDNLFGGNGAAILVGGDGKDKLKGAQGDELLIGGQVDTDWESLFDVDTAATLTALDTAMTKWATGNLANTMDILGGVLDDEDKDDLFGEKGGDVLLGGARDKMKK